MLGKALDEKWKAVKHSARQPKHDQRKLKSRGSSGLQPVIFFLQLT